MTVNVPFTCVTEIEYDVPPVIYMRKPATEIELMCSKHVVIVKIRLLSN
jgi:hypothetical protein